MMDKNTADQKNALDLLKDLSIQDFLDVGLNQVAYIKRIDAVAGKFSIHAADGSQISVMDTYDTAIDSIRVHDLFPVTVH